MSLITKEPSFMKIHVNRVPDEGLKKRVTYEPAALDMERDDVRVHESFAVDIRIQRVDQQLVVQAKIRCPVMLTCARCLEEFGSTVTTDAVLSYTVQLSDVIDITDDVRQEIILAYPMVSVCTPACKGLCAQCGTNLNHDACEHSTQASV